RRECWRQRCRWCACGASIRSRRSAHERPRAAGGVEEPRAAAPCGGRATRGLARGRAGRAGADRGTERGGEDDAAGGGGGAAPAGCRRGPPGGPLPHGHGAGGEAGGPRSCGRLRLPALEPARRAHRPGERAADGRAREDAAPRGGARDGAPARAAGCGPTPGAPARHALRRRGAAGGGRARARAPARGGAGRRAHREPGQRRGPGGGGEPAGAGPRPRRRGGGGHPRPPARRLPHPPPAQPGRAAARRDGLSAMASAFLRTLNYASVNEDWRTEAEALRVGSSDSVLCVTGGGDRPLNLLALDPARVVAIDLNPAQNHLLTLKVAAMRRLPFEEYAAFLGLTRPPASWRAQRWHALRGELPPASRGFWDRHRRPIRAGVIYQGRWERYYLRGAGLGPGLP